jgi:hypothetical protein
MDSGTDLDVTSVLRRINDRFIRLGKGTPSHEVKAALGRRRHLLDKLIQQKIIQTTPDNLLPCLRVLELEDEATRTYCYNCTEMVLKALKWLYNGSGPKRYTVNEILSATTQRIDPAALPEMVTIGMLFATDFSAYFGGWGSTVDGPIIALDVLDEILDFDSFDSAWREELRKRTDRGFSGERVVDMMKGDNRPDQLAGATPVTDVGAASAQSNITHLEDPPMPFTNHDILVLISHSSKDAVLASELTEFLRVGLALRPEQIRCSSVDGYRLPAGGHTETQLREEVNSTKVLIGLITPNSLSSPYVLFELGARWGAELPMLPLLAGMQPHEMRGPLSFLNALSASNEAQLHQLLSDISKLLSVPVQTPASYLRYLHTVKQKADAVSGGTLAHLTAQESMFFAESVCWKRDNDGREGPYCPNCYEDKKKEIHLTPGATRGTYSCGVCRNTFRTSEYRPGPRQTRSEPRW